jgi:hypothetical protein
LFLENISIYKHADELQALARQSFGFSPQKEAFQINVSICQHSIECALEGR